MFSDYTNTMSYSDERLIDRGPYSQHHHHTPPTQGPPRDEYAGLLTNREKEWLVKIQMIQLHTEDPYTDDYYYTVS